MASIHAMITRELRADIARFDSIRLWPTTSATQRRRCLVTPC
jgi:hypothetical protein